MTTKSNIDLHPFFAQRRRGKRLEGSGLPDYHYDWRGEDYDVWDDGTVHVGLYPYGLDDGGDDSGESWWDDVRDWWDDVRDWWDDIFGGDTSEASDGPPYDKIEYDNPGEGSYNIGRVDHTYSNRHAGEGGGG